MPSTLARHDAILQRVISADGGQVFKTVGDAFCVAFADPLAALLAARDAQHALMAEPWSVTGPLRVRMALHSGVAEARDGDYFGAPLNRVARVLGLGHGGQILLTATSAELVRDRLPPDVSLRDLGTHQLKDLARPEQVFQVVAADLLTDFPPLRSRDTRLRILPTPPNPLIGREAELTALDTLLDAAALRLLTLLGPGGTGKTRLAIATAAELADRFADGVCFVNLAPVRDPALVMPTIGRTLGLQESPERPMATAVIEFLRAKALLLVLDNCEQVIDAAPDIAALLAASPQLRIIVTSREALRIAAERLYLVPPLTLPTEGDESLSAPAAQLFLARARAGRGDMSLTGTTSAAVAAICRRLDGLPLAIELAAARLRHLTPQALLARLERPLDLLTSGARDLPTRQQTLRASIVWSYDLLSEPEQALFRRLGGFVGGWDLAAAEAVGELDGETLDLLSGLIDKSLIGQVAGAGDEPRYTMLETIREYALEQLEASNEAEATRERHTAYFLALAERARPEQFGPNAVFWLDHLEEEHPNLRAALSAALANGWYDRVARYCIALRWFWFYRSHFAEVIAWMSTGWEHRDAMTPHIRANLLRECGWFLSSPARRAQASEESVALYRELGDRHGLAWALTDFGVQRFHDGDIESARGLAEECLPLAREFADPPLLVSALYVFGNVQTCDGAVEGARQAFEEGLMLARHTGDLHAVSDMFYSLGDLENTIGAYALAEANYWESASLRGKMGDRRGMAAQLRNMGEVVCRQGAYDRGLPLLADSLRVFREIAWPMGVGQTQDILAWIANRFGQPDRAARFLGAEEMFRITAQYTIWPTARVGYEQIVRETRSALDDGLFAAAWAAGRALSVEAATAEALEWLTAMQDRLSTA